MAEIQLGQDRDRFPGESRESAWRRLRHHLDRSNTFWLGVVLTSNLDVAHSLAQQAELNRRHAHAPFLLLQPKTPADLVRLYLEIENGPEPPGCTWIEAVHLPDSAGHSSEGELTWREAWIELLQSLNHRRDTLRSRLGGLVLVGPPLVKTLAMQVSTDLWSVLAFLSEISQPLSSSTDNKTRGLAVADDLTGIGKASRAPILQERAITYWSGEDLDEEVAEDIAFLMEADDSSLSGPLRQRLSARVEWAVEHGHLQVATVLLVRRAALRLTSGELEAGLRDIEQAIGMIRDLVAVYPPDYYRYILARSLMAVGSTLAKIGRYDEALAAEQEAVALYRELVPRLYRGELRNAADPDGYRPGLADVLYNLGITFSALGRHDEALAVEREAVALYRELAAVNPDRYRPDLARSLTSLGATLAKLGHFSEAQTDHEKSATIYEEPAVIYHELDDVNPGRYRPDLADVLHNLGITFSALGRHDEALAVEREAVALYRELAAANPGRYRPGLASVLHNLGITFSELGHHDEAMAAGREAVALYRELAATAPDRYRLDLARSLSDLADTLSALEDDASAEAARAEAAALREEEESLPGTGA
jgi:tetratricopeptide (TPR) repeat protein